MSELESIVLEPEEPATAAVIWLHGLGADGNDFVPIVDQLQLPSHSAIRFIFPHAPVRPITINQNYPMPGWYDIRSLDDFADEDEAGIKESSAILQQLCETQEADGIASSRIVIAGFSQGGAIALHCGMRFPRPLAGIMALSTYLPLADTLPDEINEDVVEVPVFMAHGRQDEVITYDVAEQSKETLIGHNVDIQWHEYDMGHAVCPDEIRDIRQWLSQVL